MRKLLLLLMVFSTYAMIAQNNIDYVSNPTEEDINPKEQDVKPTIYSGDKPKPLRKTNKKADRLYNQLGYMAFIEKYEKLNNEEKSDWVSIIRIANSYRLNGETAQAEFWYSKAISHSNDPAVFLNYAQVLQSNGKCKDAIQWYHNYLAIASPKETESRSFLDNCNIENSFKSHSEVAVLNMENINSSSLDFCAVPFQGGLVFTSNRGRDRLIGVTDKWSKNNFSDLFYAEKNANGSFDKVKPFIKEINSHFHDGVASFDKGETKMFFTRSHGKKKNGLSYLKIYTANIDENEWSDIEVLPYSEGDFASCHPTLSTDGKQMYFSSNREGGLGGMDIYVSNFDGLKWGQPINMGPKVNSSGNDIFPFMSNDNVLYFASDGHMGIGGLDIFKIEKTKNNSDTQWSDLSNIGQPFNTEKDDFGFFIDADNQSGYFSSNRYGGKGGDDIYSWSGNLSPDENQSQALMGKVLDKTTGFDISDAEVTLYCWTTGVKMKLPFRVDGSFSMELDCGMDYTVKIEKEGFFIGEKSINVPVGKCAMASPQIVNFLLEPKVKLQETIAQSGQENIVEELKSHFLGNKDKDFEKDQVIEIKDVYYDYNQWTLRSDAKFSLDKVVELMKFYPKMEIEMSSHTDARGKRSYNTELSHKRALATMNYLQERGVSIHRLTSKGYGESQLKNSCEDGIHCSEQEHQINRRTEIRIRKM